MHDVEYKRNGKTKYSGMVPSQMEYCRNIPEYSRMLLNLELVRAGMIPVSFRNILCLFLPYSGSVPFIVLPYSGSVPFVFRSYSGAVPFIFRSYSSEFSGPHNPQTQSPAHSTCNTTTLSSSVSRQVPHRSRRLTHGVLEQGLSLQLHVLAWPGFHDC